MDVEEEFMSTGMCPFFLEDIFSITAGHLLQPKIISLSLSLSKLPQTEQIYQARIKGIGLYAYTYLTRLPT